jgi:hypothetical protein
MGVSKLSKLGLPLLWGHITLCADLRLKWGLKQNYSSLWNSNEDMSHTICTQGNWVDFQLLVVGSQTANLIFCPSFGHNLCFRCPNGSYEPILHIYASIVFQWYKEILNPLGFNPWNLSLNIRESTETPTPKVGVPLGMWGSIPSQFFTLLGACSMIPRLPSWPATLQALALVASPRLMLQQKLKILNKGKGFWSTKVRT